MSAYSKRQVVPDFSSELDDGVGNTSSISANHRDMCKFCENESRDFKRVVGVIQRLYDLATSYGGEDKAFSRM